MLVYAHIHVLSSPMPSHYSDYGKGWGFGLHPCNLAYSLLIPTTSGGLAILQSPTTAATLAPLSLLEATVTDPEHSLIAALERRRGDMTGEAFARYLGISHGHWSKVRRGVVPVGHRMAQRILGQYPELWREVQDALFPRQEAAA